MRIQFNQAGEPALVKHADGGVSVAIPIAVKRNRGRRDVLLPPGVALTTLPEPQELTALQAALTQALLRQRMLEEGRARSTREIARKECVDDRYVARFRNLTTLAPEIVAATLDETLPEEVTLGALSVNPAVMWDEQRRTLGMAE
jgi:hypothetical protein